MGGLGSHMVNLTWVDVPEQQRHPTFTLAAVRSAVLAKVRFGLADAVETAYRRNARHMTQI